MIYTGITALVWLTYFIVSLIALFYSYKFYQDLETKAEFQDVKSVTPLKNLNLTLFVINIFVIFFSLLLGLFVTQKSTGIRFVS